MSITKVVVTGGAGFVGSHVAEHFARKQSEVVVCDNVSRGEALGKTFDDPWYNWNYLKNNFRNIKLLRADVRDFPSIKDASEAADAIIHSAGQVAVTTSLADPKTDFEINALGTFNVLEAARANDCAVVFCSTNKVYGENVNAIPVKGESKRYVFTDPVFKNGIPEDFSIDRTWHTPYGASKLAGDVYVQDYAHTYGLKTGVFRMSCIYGERQFGVEDQGWVAWFTIATLTGRPLTIYGDGKQVRDVLYVSDLTVAFDKFLASSIKHDVFNIGGGPENALSLIELLDLLRELTGKQPKVQYSDWRQADQKIYISDIRKAEAKLRWKPSITSRDGVTRLSQWVGQNLPLFN